MGAAAFPVFLRDLEGEVLEKLRLACCLLDILQRDFRIFSPLQLRELQAPEKFFRLSNLAYSVALNAAHK